MSKVRLESSNGRNTITSLKADLCSTVLNTPVTSRSMRTTESMTHARSLKILKRVDPVL